MSGLLLLIPPCRRRCSPCMHLKAGAGGFRREVQPRRQHWFLNEKSGFPSRTPAFCSVSRGQRRLGEKEYRAPSVTPGVALRVRTQGPHVNSQHILHRRYEGAIRLGRNDPALFAVGLDNVFFSTRPIVLSLARSTRDCPEFRVWFGHNGKKGDIPWPDARNPRSQMLFLISFLVALIPRRPLIRTAFWTI